MLQPQSSLAKATQLVPELDEKLAMIEETFQQIQESKDDNVLLKYLELNSFDSHTNSEGRTPFTITKTIEKRPDEAFGFEMSWSNPPKINSVKNLSQCSGLRRGDYIIFVADTNIVTMPKENVIELIRMQENFLTLEIFRPIEDLSSKLIIDKLASQSTPLARPAGSSLSIDLTRKAIDLLETTPKSRKSCLFKQPKICFQPTVGSGVIV